MQCNRVSAKDLSFSPEINSCSSDPCKNGGSCNIVVGASYVCGCKSGYFGKHCESKVHYVYNSTD